MASFIDFRNPPGSDRRADRLIRATSEPLWLRRVLIGIVLAFFILFLGLPLVVVFQGALAQGVDTFLRAFTDHDILHSVGITLIVALIAVPTNAVFGIAAAWAVTRYNFRGRQLLLALIDLPLWVSPVIGGLVYVLLYGRRGYMGPWLAAHDIRIIFALPGMVMATTFVTFPFVARSLIPLMQAQGCEEEEAALTNTMPLEIERLYGDYLFAAAFAVASALSLLALVTLVLKTLAEWENARQFEISQRSLLSGSIDHS